MSMDTPNARPTPLTESRNADTWDIDTQPTLALVARINAEDRKVPEAVGRVLPQIAQAVDAIAASLASGGRLIYMGAGTSGRLGVLDASECPPTYGTAPDQVVALIAGGRDAMFAAKEGAEDDAEQGAADLEAIGVSSRDTVVGIAASGGTPYVLGGLRRAREAGAVTVAVACNPDCPVGRAADIAILPVVGPEAVSGSTRMKAGTAQKLVLNMLSTGAMIRVGKTYGNLMVDMRATNDKLRRRAVRMVAEVTGESAESAAALLAACDGETKTACCMALTGLDAAGARAALAESGGFLARALAAHGVPDRRRMQEGGAR